ncbi:uncharacterized protein PHALS_12969 [Plasmopara halstedii]|uniref:Uncharacterized protein n=1 Tax=Plasmopara halstedii TaxID=4781 RepID=A0A0P1APE2_PLAHL|nr:uncharacterized protein PHALS_12969 [Plasmopara halstedii]CEG42717.1 hypothetical protein PHALS_12969 [Plasmopara halstedii]|eukprot:XP_024579086.1 hypothetical protein PHALS_12969 [Plasmopara halstedii]
MNPHKSMDMLHMHPHVHAIRAEEHWTQFKDMPENCATKRKQAHVALHNLTQYSKAGARKSAPQIYFCRAFQNIFRQDCVEACIVPWTRSEARGYLMHDEKDNTPTGRHVVMQRCLLNHM